MGIILRKWIGGSLLVLLGLLLQGCDHIDTHSHLNNYSSATQPCDYTEAIDKALLFMEDYDVSRAIYMPQPYPAGSAGNSVKCKSYEVLPGVLATHSDKFIYMGGGVTLNPTIQQYSSVVLPLTVRDEFIKEAFKILQGGAVGFGELTAEHFSLKFGHPYESAPADGQLFMTLGRIADHYGVAMDIHMEAISEDMALPSFLRTFDHDDDASTPPLRSENPDQLTENISKLERLLVANRNARIIWSHAGWGHTGHRTTTLMRRLLSDHPNLYMSIKFRRGLAPETPNYPLKDGSNELKLEWSELITEFPKRFMIGQDQHYPQNTGEGAMKRSVKFLSQLGLNNMTSALRKNVAIDNAERIYRLEEKLICHQEPLSSDVSAGGSSAPGPAQTMWISRLQWPIHVSHADKPGPCNSDLALF